MGTNVSQASDITQITLAKPGNDKLCVADLSLRVNNTLAYTHTYGNTATSCAWLGGEDVLSVDYGELRNSVSWAQLGNETFAGYAGEDLRSIIQAQFGQDRNSTRLNSSP